LALGKRPPQLQDEDRSTGSNPNQQFGRKKWWAGKSSDRGRSENTSGGSDVEDRINALAEALGMPPKELASAIASAVKQYVPPASLSSMSLAAAKETGHSATTNILWAQSEEEGEGGGKDGVVGDVLGSVVGMDEPPEA